MRRGISLRRRMSRRLRRVADIPQLCDSRELRERLEPTKAKSRRIVQRASDFAQRMRINEVAEGYLGERLKGVKSRI
jgi:hypothetical protein